MKLKKVLFSCFIIVILGTLYEIIKIRKKKTVRIKTNYYASIKTNTANVYSAANASSSVIATINIKNIPIFVQFCEKNWCKVKLFDGTNGFIKTIVVSRQRTAIVKEKTELYSLPNSRNILASFYPNVVVKFAKNEDNNWCFVNYDSLKGYVKCSTLLIDLT